MAHLAAGVSQQPIISPQVATPQARHVHRQLRRQPLPALRAVHIFSWTQPTSKEHSRGRASMHPWENLTCKTVTTHRQIGQSTGE